MKLSSLSLIAVIAVAGVATAQDSSGVRRYSSISNGWQGAGKIALAGHYAYVPTGNTGLRIVDRSDRSHPIEVGSLDTPGQANAAAVAGSICYVADENEGVRVINVANPARPAEIGVAQTVGLAKDALVSGSYLYVADYTEGVRIFDVTNPRQPNEIGAYNPEGFAYDLELSGTTLFVADGSMVRALNVADPTRPSMIGHFEMANAKSLALAGTRLFVTSAAAGVKLLDVTNPASITEVSTYNTPGTANGVCVLDDNCFVADGLGGMRVVSYANPRFPNEVGHFRPIGTGFAVSADWGAVFLSNGVTLYLLDCFEVMDVEESSAIAPTEFILSEAYPNPFNGATRVAFNLPTATNVSLEILDGNGRLVESLAQGWREAGTHQVEFNGDGRSSGVYLLRLQANGATRYRNLMLIK